MTRQQHQQKHNNIIDQIYYSRSQSELETCMIARVLGRMAERLESFLIMSLAGRRCKDKKED